MYFEELMRSRWCVALATRSGPEWLNFPMGRETVMTSVRWNEGEWPYFTPVEGKMSGWEMPLENLDIEGSGYVLHHFPLKKTSANQDSPLISLGAVEGDAFDFPPNSTLPAHFTYWRYPIESSYIVSPPEKPNSLRLTPSKLNLTALNGNYAGPDGQTFIGRRQQDTLFSYSVELDFQPTEEEEEAGVTVFLTQNHHLDLGVVLLPASSSTQAFPGHNFTTGGIRLISSFNFGSELCHMLLFPLMLWHPYQRTGLINHSGWRFGLPT